MSKSAPLRPQQPITNLEALSCVADVVQNCWGGAGIYCLRIDLLPITRRYSIKLSRDCSPGGLSSPERHNSTWFCPNRRRGNAGERASRSERVSRQPAPWSLLCFSQKAIPCVWPEQTPCQLSLARSYQIEAFIEPDIKLVYFRVKCALLTPYQSQHNYTHRYCSYLCNDPNSPYPLTIGRTRQWSICMD
jgi:hypothetical protein